MSDQLQPFPLRLAHAWVALYTRGLPAECRDARRAELTSDLWEHVHDALPGGAEVLPAAILGRVLAGIPADIAWRVEERAWVRTSSMSHAVWYRHPIVIVVIAVITGMVAIVGLPGPVAAFLAGLMVLALISHARGLIERPAAIPSGKDPSMQNRANPRRATLLIVLAVSVIVMAITYAYAMSLETWGDTRGLIFLVLGWSSLAVAIGALILLVVDVARAHRR